MKKKQFVTGIVGIHVVFLFLYIHKASQCVYEGYHLQKLQGQLRQLQQKKESLMTHLSTLKNPHTVQEFAIQTLQMKSITLNQVQRL